jgi:hypothetical protein
MRPALVRKQPQPQPVAVQPEPLRTFAQCLTRLESSVLYQRREMDTRTAQAVSHKAALWYLDTEYVDRYLAMRVVSHGQRKVK